ncbi:MAG TPA: UDP-N-acetylglucosamine 2-epimerase (non-hydrolyzing) [Candidatus Solibacter sp.]|nr:UDP-N-acetylglucosamine 2-epimerase (non-hydrolyzing) [Candidatus Solibacter sp.]
MSRRPVVGVVFGTRPEAIKMVPVIFELQKRSDEFQPVLIATSQHRQMLDQVLEVFRIHPEIDLDLMQPNQSLNSLTRRILEATDSVLQSTPLDCLMIQGDTTTAFGAALAAFYRRVPVAHVEAGLRSRDIYNPYPEEVNRRLAGVVTELNFAPTPLARKNLLAEGVASEKIAVTGNTVVDSVKMLLEMKALDRPLPEGVPDDDSRIILITSHRRESWGVELENICGAIAELVHSFPDCRVVYPVHMNPNVRTTVMSLLGNMDRVHLTEPLDYFGFLSLLRRCYFVLTDSGGVQEEAPTFGKPVLVLRKVTERPEASIMGLSRIVGTSRSAIVEEASELFSNRAAYRSMSEGGNPYGDGRAAERIVESLSRWFNGKKPLLEHWRQFHGMARVEQVEVNLVAR